jgi:UTP-glucose-1-phosphate uridylyltransferase
VIAAHTVCILTAGKGTRMGALGKILNKSLHTIDGKAIITHIINKFPQDAEFVVGVGFLGKQVRNYLQIAHGQRKISFVEIDNFDGPGSGPGYSLLCCQSQLQKPFYFVSCDTLWDNELDWTLDKNWFGVAHVSPADSVHYCNLKVMGTSVVELRDKNRVEDESYQAFVGLCHIKDFQVFWTALGNTEKVAGEHQISNGILALIAQSDAQALNVEWTDVGDAGKYKKTVSRYENYDFSKENEALYIVNRKVIKFFADASITERRVQKSRLNPMVFPPITQHAGQFYAYEFQPGETLYQVNSRDTFGRLLDWLGLHLWKRQKVDQELMRATCHKFYQVKTLERLSMFDRKYAYSDAPSVVNGRNIPATSELLKMVPWVRLTDGIPCFIHGDLQFDNILFDAANQSFMLLDWRQDFGGHIEFGDLYYDLAKLYGGIVLNYDFIKLNLLSYDESGRDITFDFAQRFQAKNYLQQLSQYISSNGYDLTKVKILVALIYLNMSPLHHFPFDKMLYSLGRDLLFTELINQQPLDAVRHGK